MTWYWHDMHVCIWSFVDLFWFFVFQIWSFVPGNTCISFLVRNWSFFVRILYFGFLVYSFVVRILSFVFWIWYFVVWILSFVLWICSLVCLDFNRYFFLIDSVGRAVHASAFLYNSHFNALPLLFSLLENRTESRQFLWSITKHSEMWRSLRKRHVLAV